MPEYVTIGRNDIKIGMDITLQLMPDGNRGQGGLVEVFHDLGITLKCGTDEYIRSFAWHEVHHIVEEQMLPAEECMSFHQGNCSGVVDYCYAPSGSSLPRCVKHNDERWAQYDKSETERYADSDVPPSNFDPSYAGESWDGD